MKNQQSYRFTRFALSSYQSGRVELVSTFAVDSLNYSPSEFIPSGGTARSLVIGFLRGEKNIPKLECDDGMYLEQEALNSLARDLPSEVLEVVDL